MRNEIKLGTLISTLDHETEKWSKDLSVPGGYFDEPQSSQRYAKSLSVREVGIIG